MTAGLTPNASGDECAKERSRPAIWPAAGYVSFLSTREHRSCSLLVSKVTGSDDDDMTTPSIERAARAFALAGSGQDEWDALDTGTQERLKDAVRAALSQLREPGAAAIRAGARKAKAYHRSPAVQVEATWQGMIDAILHEH